MATRLAWSLHMRETMAYLYLLRPEQWTKNLFVFAGLAFGRKLTDAHSVLLAVLGFACFCLVSSAVYILNDIHDRAEDRLHPQKRHRPLAAGTVTVQGALVFCLMLLVVGVGGAYVIDRAFFLVAVFYFVLQLAYTFALKQVPVLDVIIIGTGFVLRAVAGAVLVHVAISHWLIICTFTLCLFMGFSKRRCELNVLTEQNGLTHAVRHRRTLYAYTPDLLNHMTTVTAGIAVMTFLLYSTDKRTLEVFGTNYLVYTLPLVVYAVFRFALLVEHGRVDGPTAVLLKDRPFQTALILWAISALIIVYRGKEIGEWFRRFTSEGGM